MATISISIDNSQVPRVLAALAPIANPLGTTSPVTVDAAWVSAYLKKHIREIVKDFERDAAIQQAQAAAQATLPADIN